MSQTKLAATTGRTTGSPASRRLRATDHIPGVLYGHGMTPISLTVERRGLRAALNGPAGVNTVLALEVDGTSYPAVIKELQRHPVRRNVSHIDFLQVNMNEAITVNVPLHLVGEAKAVQANNGLVDPAVDHIEVSCTPSNMPNEFVYDISDMDVTDVIRLSQLTMPKGVTALGDPDMPIITVLLIAAESQAATGAAGEGTEGAAAGEADTDASGAESASE